MLPCSAVPTLNLWQRPVANLGNNEEEGRGGNFQQSFGLCQASLLADVCCHFATYDTKTPTIWIHETKLRNGINEVNKIQFKKRNLLAAEEIASLAEWYWLCSSVFLVLNLTGKRLGMPVRILAGSKYLLNPYHINKTVDTTKFRNILQQINE